MKKLSYLIVLVLILSLTLTGCLLSNVGQVPATEQSGISYLTKAIEGDPFVTTLFAGQDIPVGTVSVWNDEVELHVTYNTTGGWVMTETHLAVATSLTGIPQTKKGNPIPGKFPYQCCYDEGGSEWVFQIKEDGDEDAVCDAVGTDLLTEITYTIPFTWDPCTELYIAAHAVVVDMNIDSMMEKVVVSRPGIDAYGPLDSYVGLEDPLWGSLIPAVATKPHSAWSPVSLLFPDATWISTTYLAVDPVNDRWRWFHDEITLPEKGIYISSGMVVATADNAEEFYFNEESIGSSQSWPTITTYSIEPKPGTNTLDFIVKNWGSSTGLIYKATIVYYPEESAWAGTSEGEMQFLGNNWATYFTYTVVKECCDFNAVDNWELDMYIGLTPYARFIIITNQVDGDINGLFGLGYDITGAPTGIITGTIDGCSINMLYERTDIVTDYTADFEGTIAADGNSMSGTWSDYARNDEPWTMTRQ
jgi:hypothetical protein